MSTVPVVLVSGLHAEVRGELAQRLLAGTSHSVAVHHDLRSVADGGVQRVILDAGGVRERTEVRLADGCVSCTIRDDLPPTVERLVGDVRLLVVELWGSVEPPVVAEQVAELPGVHLVAVLTAVDATGLLADIGSADRLGDWALTAVVDDERYVAEVLSRQIEYATALVLCPGENPEHTTIAATMLDHLGAGTPVRLLGSPAPGREPATPLVGGGAPVDIAALAARVDPATLRLPGERDSGEVSSVLWRRLRPLHPARLYEAIGELTLCAVRSRGRFWMANRSETMLAWDCVAGLLTIEDRGPWLAALPAAAWDMIPPARRAAAALDWYPKLGDRLQLIGFTGPNLDRDAIHALLDSCLLTKDEMLAGSDSWASYADPLATVLDP
jgi:G3E family GTPase